MITGNTAYSGNAVTVSTWLKFDSLNGTASCGAGANGLQYIIFKRNTLLGRFEGFALLKDYANKLSFAVGSSTQNQTSV